MSWSGTVRCRHCYDEGHNRRSCPQLTENYKQRAQREIDSGTSHDEGHYQREYAKRSGVWLHSGEKAKELRRNRRGSVRRCKYCAKTGHNTRTCTELKKAKAEALVETKRVRRAIVEALAESGLGIGALVVRGAEDARTGYMVTGFHFDNLNHESVRHNPNVVFLKALNPDAVNRWDRETSVPLPAIENVNENSWNDYTKLAGPVSGSAVVSCIPEGWVEDESFLEGMFEDRQSPNWRDNRYDY